MTKSEKKALGMLLLIIAIVVGSVAWAVYVYGDWTCAVSECRRVKELP